MAKSPDVLKQFGERVRQLRQARGWSQERLAAEVGIDRTYIGGVERGERNLGLRNVYKIAEALGVHPAELFKSGGAS